MLFSYRVADTATRESQKMRSIIKGILTFTLTVGIGTTALAQQAQAACDSHSYCHIDIGVSCIGCAVGQDCSCIVLGLSG